MFPVAPVLHHPIIGESAFRLYQISPFRPIAPLVTANVQAVNKYEGLLQPTHWSREPAKGKGTETEVSSARRFHSVSVLQPLSEKRNVPQVKNATH